MSFNNTLLLFLLFAGFGAGSSTREASLGYGKISNISKVSTGLGIGSDTSDVDLYFIFFLVVYKNGTYRRFDEGPNVPAGFNPTNGVRSKDIVISEQTGVTARLYTPKDYETKGKKLPVLIYLHGGGFCTGSAAQKDIHNFVTTIVDKANAIALSVNFRVPPEHFLPIAYDDSWEALKWLANHAMGKGPEQLLTNFANFSSVFIAGDSSGANIAHNVAMRFGSERLENMELAGLILLSPYFLASTPTPSMMKVDESSRNNMTKIWSFMCPKTSGLDDPRVNPMIDPKLSSMGCNKVLINVAERDPLVDVGKLYAGALERSGKSVEIFESEGKGHDHQLKEMDDEVMDRVTHFVNSYEPSDMLSRFLLITVLVWHVCVTL